MVTCSNRLTEILELLIQPYSIETKLDDTISIVILLSSIQVSLQILITVAMKILAENIIASDSVPNGHSKKQKILVTTANKDLTKYAAPAASICVVYGDPNVERKKRWRNSFNADSLLCIVRNVQIGNQIRLLIYK